MAYPEELHCVNAEDCATYNSRIMKHLMKQKMGKNKTFYQSQMVVPQMRSSQQIVNVSGQQRRLSKEVPSARNMLNISSKADLNVSQ